MCSFQSVQFMFVFYLCCFVCFIRNIICVSDARLAQGTNLSLGDALQFLREYDAEAAGMCFRVSSAQWNYATNITDFNKRRMIEEQTLRAKFERLSWRKAVSFEWSRLPDPMARRQLRMLVTEGRASLDDEKYNEIYHLIAEMKDIYASTRICPYNSFDSRYCDLELDPDVTKIMAHSRNPDELAHIWKEWHDRIGPPMKNKFMRYVQLANQAARMNGFNDAGEQMRFAYETENFESELLDTWLKLEPLYKELHTYVRKRLIQRYGEKYIRPDGPIPTHLLGNLWAQDWSNIKDIVVPFPQIRNVDVTEEMLRQGFTPLRMFQMAEEFFTSLGLKAMPPEFWRYSMIEKPLDRRVQCTASAWDFCNRIDYRIKQCTQINMENLISTHHEMAHIQYYLQYADQPYLYRDGANPGFHEAVASAISMSINNPVHLHRRGLFNNNTDIYETNMNFLMSIALEKVAYAPFAYLVDMWRYKIFRDGVKNMNSQWWEMRLQYQGVVPPMPRTENHLDPVSKRHVAADLPYSRYYVALLLQFQIHEALCDAAGFSGQLHMCEIYRSREAGRILGEALKNGKSKHWKDIIRILTRGKTDRLSAEPMLRYFEPFYQWLRVQNRDEIIVGWKPNMDDTALFQSLHSSKSNCSSSIIILFITFVTVHYFNL